MKIISLLILSLFAIQIRCNSNLHNEKKYIYYLHGRIIEIQGKNAVSDEYGKYEFDSIVNAFKDSNSIVIAEVRNENVDYLQYAKKVSKEIDSLVKSGIKSKNISVIGASKGAIIASNISSINSNPINYVFLAGNNNYQEEHNEWKFHGQVLCFYDDSDTIAGKNYDYWKNKPNYTTKFEQIKIDKKLGHGFLYKPYKDWVEPTKKWILTQEL
ncbi:hypothetical protein [uncultured Flavobacterium sp.]|uniref:hypothetical protein n=1 Tax=uncultured Flavobacterium sp. TaxID=165435 RepID=UPI0030EC94FA|tara:strand:+ start:310808 stop:311446 length:639 start_codon:yes stop_codon:yes gene_type:complete